MSKDKKETGTSEELPEIERPALVPFVKTSAPGKINRTLDGLGALYRHANPGKDCRWVYSPQHKPELSNVIQRMAEGYRKVLVKDLGDVSSFIEGHEPDDTLRVGDVILMGIAEEERQELIAQLDERARDQAATVEAAYYEEIEGGGLESRSGEVHRAKPRGRSIIEERDHIYDLEQRTVQHGE